MVNSYLGQGFTVMTTAVKKTLSPPPSLARAAEEMDTRAEGNTLSAVIQDVKKPEPKACARNASLSTALR